MNVTEFVTAVAQKIDGQDNYDIVTADTDSPVTVVWGVGQQPDTIMVSTHDGDVFAVRVERLASRG